VGEAISGISEEMGDVGLAMQRAEDKVAQMQARSGALDELMASGALDDFTSSNDPIQAELDRTGNTPAVEAELARLKGELTGGNAQQRPAIEPGADQLTPPAAAPPASTDQRTAANPEESR
jgi:phage shock protein A